MRNLWLLLTASALTAFAAGASAVDLKGTVFEKAGDHYNLDPLLIYSVALIESGTNDESLENGVSPYPWTLRSDRPFYGKNRRDAERELARLLSEKKSVDVGLMQINVRWHGHRVKNPMDLLDPLKNVMVGASILDERIRQYPEDAIRAVGSYHSSNKERALWYAKHVFRVYTALEAQCRK